MADEKESLQAAQASNRDVPADPPSPKQDCSDIVNISIFFDGTGNNKKDDEEPKKWSNPARLWRAASMSADLSNAIYPIYVSGVGTPFNGKAANWLDSLLVPVEDSLPGSVGGAGGTRRTEFGQDNVNETLRRVLLDNAQKLNATTKAYADKSKNESLSELSKALAEHRLIKMINLSIFGFSRGAALGRAFSNDFLKKCKTDKAGQLTYQGYPIRMHFMGLFDTVASFGVPAGNMDSLFTEKNLKVPSQVERCVHYVAAHEIRFSFPSDLIRQHGKLMPNWTEIVYPGVHSDVGGGYEPISQGMTNNYARIPMRDMMSEAVKSGVRMLAYGDIEKINATLFDERFAIKPEAEKAYKDYMASVSPGGTTEQIVATHMKALYSAYGTMSRKGIKTPDQKWDIGHALIGHVSMEREVRALRSRMSGGGLMLQQSMMPTQALQFSGTEYGQIVSPEAWRLQAWDSTASAAVLALIGNYVHDSKYGFLYSAEPFSYFRPRGMAESSHNVLAQGLQWLDQNIDAAKEGVIKIYNGAAGVVVETWQAGKLIATKTYKVGEKFVVDTVQAGEKYTVEVYQTSKKVVITKIEEGEKFIVTSIDTAKKEASSAYDAAKKEVSSAYDTAKKEASSAYDTAKKEASSAYDAAKNKAADLAKQAQQGAQHASDVVGKAVDDGTKAIEDNWKAAKTLLGW